MTTAQVAQSAERRPNRVAGPIEPASLAQGTLEPAAFPTLDADDIRRLPGETFLIERPRTDTDACAAGWSVRHREIVPFTRLGLYRRGGSG